MFLNVKELELRKIRFDETIEAGRIDFSGAELEQAGPLSAKGTAELIAYSEGDIRIQGRYTVEMTAQCDRCLGRARFELDAGFDLFYRPMAVIAKDEEIEIDQSETEVGFYANDGIELDDILREQVLLALPLQRVCGEKCLGICPVCGKNRNEVLCGCKTDAVDDRWGALRNLEI